MRGGCDCPAVVAEPELEHRAVEPAALAGESCDQLWVVGEGYLPVANVAIADPEPRSTARLRRPPKRPRNGTPPSGTSRGVCGGSPFDESIVDHEVDRGSRGVPEGGCG